MKIARQLSRNITFILQNYSFSSKQQNFYLAFFSFAQKYRKSKNSRRAVMPSATLSSEGATLNRVLGTGKSFHFSTSVHSRVDVTSDPLLMNGTSPVFIFLTTTGTTFVMFGVSALSINAAGHICLRKVLRSHRSP